MHSLGCDLTWATLAKLLILLRPMLNCTFHDLRSKAEPCGVHLPQDDGSFFTRLKCDIVSRSFEWLQELELVKLSIVDLFRVSRLGFPVDEMNVAVAFFCHGEVLFDLRGSLSLKVGDFLLSKPLLCATPHELSDQFIPIKETLLIAQEVCGRLSVATDTELSVLSIVGPVEFNEHVVFASFKIFIFLPGVALPSHLSIDVS